MRKKVKINKKVLRAYYFDIFDEYPNTTRFIFEF